MQLQTEGLEPLKERVIGCAIEVHRVLGPGLMEAVYRDCLCIELRSANLRVDSERRVSLDYKGHRITNGLKMDLVVEDCLVVEIKAVDRLHPLFQAQLITYLKLAGLPAGLLMNFNETTLCAGLKRLVHPDLYLRRVEGSGVGAGAGISPLRGEMEPKTQ
jgi:GxxExxY protein